VRGLVLVVDDDPVQREILERALEGAGRRVVTAACGEAGLAAARELRPEAVVLDVVMPRLNGYQTCRALRRDPATAGCRVVMLTTKADSTDRFWAAEVGADAFLSKPADLPLLLHTLDDLTSRS
jgi:CheY-like chemotaxis protein